MADFKIKSEERINFSPSEKIFEFLTDFKNFASILPDDKVENFIHSKDECSFSIKGIAPMKIKIEQKVPVSLILYTSKGLGKFDFSLSVHFRDNLSSVEMTGAMNPFILKMAEKPLRDFVNSISIKLSELKL